MPNPKTHARDTGRGSLGSARDTGRGSDTVPPASRPTNPDEDLPGQDPAAAPPHTPTQHPQVRPQRRRGPTTHHSLPPEATQAGSCGPPSEPPGTGGATRPTAPAAPSAKARPREPGQGAQPGQRSNPPEHPATQQPRTQAPSPRVATPTPDPPSRGHEPHHPRRANRQATHLAQQCPPPKRRPQPPHQLPGLTGAPHAKPNGRAGTERSRRRAGGQDRGTEGFVEYLAGFRGGACSSVPQQCLIADIRVYDQGAGQANGDDNAGSSLEHCVLFRLCRAGPLAQRHCRPWSLACRLAKQGSSFFFYSTYFLVPKKEGRFRPILDLRGLNRFLKVLPFHMLRVADVLRTVSAGDWLVMVDLKDAYFHVPIAPHHRPFLRFMFMDKVYQFRVLPFGLSLAPRIFTRCVAAALSPLQASGVSILPYLDDWLVISPTREQVLRDTAALFSHIGNLGLKVNYAKSNLVPSQVVRYLGLVLDSSVMRASLSPERVSAILGLLRRFQHGTILQYGLVLRLMGMLASASMVVPLGLLTLRPFQVWMNSLHLDPSHHRHKVVRVSAQCLLTLRPWRREYLMLGVPMGRVASRREVVETDASLMGWGAVWRSRTVRGLWSTQQKRQHRNVLELQAVFLAPRHFLPVLKDRHVLIRSDNTSAVYHINHQGGTRCLTCLWVAHQLLMWAYPNFLSLRAMHVPGLGNTAADLLSRQKPPSGEWRLHPEVVAVIWATFGRAAVDPFASEATTHCPLWFSLREETSPLRQDALAHTWPDGLLYAFPPLPLIPKTLHRAQQGGLRLLLVAPCWPGRPWFPLLLKLLRGTPWRLPEKKDLLSQVNGRIWHPSPGHLRLFLWPHSRGPTFGVLQ
ncbi:uncharacterized protein LOC114463411 [Gouania willdenowi]|uniref:uncharacterized protein LOC114463411 n=1 Tax=Gouania willdenowi TaxID=441366 RepID=UPI00105643FE|nr:uncharacterized protein LOC114463411 [Gouania willdenowi]